MNTPKANAVLVEALSSSLRATENGLGTVPDLLRRVLQEESWREFVTPRGEIVHHEQFVEFVTTPPTHGLGATIDLLKRILADDRETLDLLDQALKGQDGGDRLSGDRPTNVDNVNIGRPVGNTAETALRRLRKEAEAGNAQAAELRAEVLAGRLSPHAAMIRAGFRSKTVSVPLGKPESIASTLRRHMKPDQLRELRRLLDDDSP
ncbi:hypothetical protein [Parafrankia elaeagni]|uniref:hypothetical protein n=1 Tax=Parafrankia elaeagni TaxID=222534 RepID=UPI000372DE81|nr:hypothetical protein [Parafrankia elaeagni]